MYKLFYSPGACSMAVHAVLNEVGADFEVQKISLPDGDHKKPEYLKINPRGNVPALLVDGKLLLEGAAMIAYLCDTHKSDLLPASGWERAQALQWLMFANSTLHPAYSRANWLNRRAKVSDDTVKGELIEQACDLVQELWDFVEQHLSESGKPFLAGNHVTSGDILVTVIANWGFLPRSFTFGPKTKALLRTVSNRPAYQKALQTEGVEYKAAA